MCTFKDSCPVPISQQPVNEYLELKRSFFFSWSTYNIRSYIYVLLIIFIVIFIALGYLIFLLFSQIFSLYKILMLDFLLVDIFFILIFLRLYLGWSYVIKRLLSATIFYEESGWYDGQIWIKATHSLTRDRLVGSYQIMPFLSRIKYTFYVFILNSFLHFYLYKLF